MSLNNQVFLSYPKEHTPQGRHPYACLMGLLCADGTVVVGWSVRHATDESRPFSKGLAKTIAFQRCVARDVIIRTTPKHANHYYYSTTDDGSVLIEVDKDRTIPYSVQQEMIIFVERCKRFFNVAEVSNFKSEL